jgi:hypothetical protein
MTITSHIQQIHASLRQIHTQGTAKPETVASVFTQVIGELVDALTELAADLDTVSRRLDALEQKH